MEAKDRSLIIGYQKIATSKDNQQYLKAVKKGASVSEVKMDKAAIDQNIKQLVSELLADSFTSVLSIEEFSLKNRLTEGLSISELRTIRAVGMYEQNPMNVIANRLDVTLATLTVAVTKLEKKGFVKRTRSEVDRRQVLVALTTKGKQAYRVHGLFYKRLINNAIEELSPEEEKVLAQALAKVKLFLDNEYEKMSAEYEAQQSKPKQV